MKNVQGRKVKLPISGHVQRILRVTLTPGMVALRAGLIIMENVHNLTCSDVSRPTILTRLFSVY